MDHLPADELTPMQQLRRTAQEAWESLVGLSQLAGREAWPDNAVRAITNAKQRVNFIVAELNGMVCCEGAARIAAQNEQTALKEPESHAGETPAIPTGGTPVPRPAAEKRVASRKHPVHQARDHKSAAAGDFEDVVMVDRNVAICGKEAGDGASGL